MLGKEMLLGKSGPSVYVQEVTVDSLAMSGLAVCQHQNLKPFGEIEELYWRTSGAMLGYFPWEVNYPCALLNNNSTIAYASKIEYVSGQTYRPSDGGPWVVRLTYIPA